MTEAVLAAQETAAHGAFSVGNLLAVLVAAWAAGRLAVHVGYPAILGELIVGILLGPPLLGLLDSSDALTIIGDLGVILMMLYIGTEIDVRDLRRASVPGLLAAVGGFVVPFGLGFGLIMLTGGSAIAGLFVGSAVGVTSLATKSRILLDLKLLDTRIASVLMAGALLSDTATLIVFAGIIGFVELGAFDVFGTARVAGEAVAFFVVTGLIGALLLPRLGRLVARVSGNDRSLAFIFVLGSGLAFAEIAEYAGLHPILGAFVAGLFLRSEALGGRVFTEVNRTIHDISVGFLAPVFFVTAGFQIDLDVFRTDLALLLGVLAVAMFGKIGGTALFYIPTQYGWREGLVLGMAMNGRGAVEIIVAGIGLELGLISAELFTILVFMAIFTTATVPILLTAGVRWLRRHGELDRSESARRRVVLCGAGPLPRTIASQLGDARPVTLIDSNPDLCAQARREGLSAVRGDVLDAETMQRARIEEAGVFAAMTTNAEVNVLAARIAREEFFVPRVLAALRASMSAGLRSFSENAGAEPLFGGHVDIGLWEGWLTTNRTEIVTERVADEGDAQRLRAVWEVQRRGLPLVVLRGENRILFDTADDLEAGDEVVLLVRANPTGDHPSTSEEVGSVS
ncbi:MAG: cation:proton antiporter [Actinobacteria bacterium]|nr:cation:proton antiporter [Actinomycetota bacterium]